MAADGTCISPRQECDLLDRLDPGVVSVVLRTELSKDQRIPDRREGAGYVFSIPRNGSIALR